MLERLFSLFFGLLDGLVSSDFFVFLIAAGFLYGIATLIRYVLMGDD